MNTKQHQLVKELFIQAVELEASDRDKFVQERCADAPEIRREVMSLLGHHFQETLLADPPPSETATQRESAARSGPVHQPGTVHQPEADYPAGTVHQPDRGRVSKPVRRAVSHALPSDADPYLVLSDIWEDNRNILRRRLIVIAYVMSGLIILSMFRLLTYRYAAYGYGVRIAGLVVTLGCGLVLQRKRDLSLAQIRFAEWAVLTVVSMLLVVVSTRLLLDASALADAIMIISINNWNCFSWSLVILIYGIFMPNTWPRAAAILLPAVLIPSLVTKFSGWIDPNVSVLLALDDYGQPIPGALLAACIAIYAAHLIHGARLTAFQARQLAQYRITRLIGQGGMGQVFEAEHLLLKRNCAVKLIQPERSDDDRALVRFEREVRSTAKLTHPHTIQVYDFGQTKDGVFFFAMELLPGMNLRQIVELSGPLPPARVVHFLMQVCAALQEAHQAGLIHRDVKPANIFASERGGILDFGKLLDFGVVRQIDLDAAAEAAKLPQTVESALRRPARGIAGTPEYMAPEQIATPDSIDARTDLYSVGTVAYYLLTGQTPLSRETAFETMMAQLNQMPKRPSELRPNIPDDLGRVVMRCLAKNPANRYGSASELQLALRQCECAGKWTQQLASAWWGEYAAPKMPTPQDLENPLIQAVDQQEG
ncbi:Serine/threonine-protein kinase PknB [Planctomycetes bacterium CA13]|uniref:Serine/threonine-protein kinase PknB n=1 Tax=Novipirellula herctigrandis TaxID=2527986 RepID=A0A5C5YNJ6_9BACT|nr:Serine/threonine-protein kinase PknB [Planctomycetes bacterium CA13]